MRFNLGKQPSFECRRRATFAWGRFRNFCSAVRARLAARAQDWRWSSVRAHLRGKDDGVTALAPVRDRFPDFADLLASEPEADLFASLRAAESVGRPLGDERFLSRLERKTGRVLKPGKRGPKPSAEDED